MAKQTEIEQPRMGVVTDPEQKARLELSQLAVRLQGVAFDSSVPVKHMLADLEDTLQRCDKDLSVAR